MGIGAMPKAIGRQGHTTRLYRHATLGEQPQAGALRQVDPTAGDPEDY